VSGRFRVENKSTWIEGDLGSFLERELYLYGEHEDQLIDHFLALSTKTAQRTALDIGANLGQHSMKFSNAFDQIHAFEPNATLWSKFENNMSLNRNDNVTLHKVGLANQDAEIPFYNIDNGNEGLGTFSDIEQYDQSREMVGKLKIVRGDDFLAAIGVDQLDAMKIDVQGFEGEVLMGLQETIRRTRPIVWLELGAATKMDMSRFERVEDFFPYPIRLFQLKHGLRLMIRGVTLVEVEAGELEIGDYVVCPRE
jgi:FkbM family methyltransferase